MHQNVTQTAGRSQQYQQPQAQTYSVKHDFDGTASLTATLTHAISDVTGVDVTDTEFTLADYIDPDALNRLFATRSEGVRHISGQVSFVLWGCQVTIHSDGHIVIQPPQPRADGIPQ